MLLVEDEIASAERFRKEVIEAGIDANITVASSRDGASAALSGGSFDIAVCDLKIPPADGGLDAEIEHGLAFLAQAGSLSPGTPLLVLSGLGNLGNLSEFLSAGPVQDCWGDGRNFRMADETKKDDFAKTLSVLADVEANVKALADIDIDFGVEGPFLGADQQRVLRIYARRMGADSVEVSRLAGGYSAAETVRCELRGSAGGLVAAKLALVEDVREENQRYERFIPASLEAGTFVSEAGLVTACAGPFGGAFYRLADRFTSSLFTWALDRDSDVVSTVRQVRAIADPWRGPRQTVKVSVGDIRRTLLADQEFDEIVQLGPESEWREFDGTQIRAVRQCQHGDLHPLNVLVDANGLPILIDFGRVGIGYAGTDPITLELGPIFNPGMRPSLGKWPSAEHAARWADLEEWIASCPFPSFGRECRQWAFGDTTDKAVYAIAWAYALRQCQYPEVDKEIAIAIATSAYRAFRRL